MPQMRLVPLALHGALDYLVGLMLVLSPFLFELPTSAPETLISIAAGVAVLAVALTSDSPSAAVRVIPQPAHEGSDYVLSLGMMLYPFALGLADRTEIVAWFVGLGVAWFVITLVTSFSRKTPPATDTATPQPPQESEAD